MSAKRPHADARGGAAVHRLVDQQDRERAGRLPVRGLPAICTCEAWKAGLKGLATYRPNSVLGAVLSVDASGRRARRRRRPGDAARGRPADQARRPSGRPHLQPHREGRDAGREAGKRSMYVTVGFLPVDGIVDGQTVTVERPVEFLLLGEQDQWLDGAMRLLSLAARSGASIAKALENLREIAWTNGAVRSGLLIRGDGARIALPRFRGRRAGLRAAAAALRARLPERRWRAGAGARTGAAMPPVWWRRRRPSLPRKRHRSRPPACSSPPEPARSARTAARTTCTTSTAAPSARTAATSAPAADRLHPRRRPCRRLFLNDEPAQRGLVSFRVRPTPTPGERPGPCTAGARGMRRPGIRPRLRGVSLWKTLGR
ncbi:MAG: hypothetical protein MZW92_30120 [Comamonadaceae bacterium]|nr:hypothetical protein [Comamonadaceae bacterium]